MINKWYFSNNGEISGPFDIASAKEVLLHNTNLYGWNPSYSQWKPVNMISEFSDVVPAAKPQAQIPKELISKFISQKNNLHEKLDLIDEDFILVNTLLSDLSKEIQYYNELTTGFNEDIVCIINNIEQSYTSLRKKRSDAIQAINIAKIEINDAVKEFGELVISKVDNITANRKSFETTSPNMVIPKNTQVNTEQIPTDFKTQPERSISKIADTSPSYETEKSGFAAVKSLFSFAS